MQSLSKLIDGMKDIRTLLSWTIMDMFSQPRCANCADKTTVHMKDNKITLTGSIDCCFVRGLLWYLKPCCFISYNCGGQSGVRLDDDIRKEMFNNVPKKEAYIIMDDKKYIVYQVDNKIRNLKMLDHRSFVVVNEISMTCPDMPYTFISKKKFDGDGFD